MSISSKPVYVDYNVIPYHGGQKVLLEGRICGIMDPFEYHYMIGEETTGDDEPAYTEEEIENMVKIHKEKYDSYDFSAWKGMSWTPTIAVVEQKITV